jgi:hypothetical protein
MGLYRGNTNVSKIYRGNTEINKIYKGQNEVYSNAPLFPVTTDLKLRLEAADYPGSGTIWTDSAQSIPFTSYGTQTSYTTIGGAPCFDFNGSGYWESGAGAGSSNLVDMRYSFTIILLYYAEGIGERDTIFEKAGTSYQSYEQEIAMTAESDQRISYYRGYNTYDYSNTGPINLTSRWNFFAAKSEGTTTRTGAAWNQSTESWVGNGYTSRSSSSITQAGAIRVGTGYAGVMENGYIGSVLVYNRALSTSEMSSLYTYYSGLYDNLNGF